MLAILSEGDDPELRKRYDGEFHQALISSCGSRELMQTHAVVFDKYFRYALRPSGLHRISPFLTSALTLTFLLHGIRSQLSDLFSHLKGNRGKALALRRRQVIHGHALSADATSSATGVNPAARSCSRSAGLRAVGQTCQPAARSSCAVARPMPEEQPVTSAVCA